MTPESSGSSSSKIKKGHVTQGWHGLYDWRLQYFNVFQHFPTLDIYQIYRFTCRIWYQPSYGFVQNRLVSKPWIPEIQRFHHVPMNTQNSATILRQIAFQDHGVNQYVSHNFPYLPSFSHNFPYLPSFSHFPIIFQSFSHHFPIIFPSFSHVPIIFPSCSHHFPMFPSLSHNFPMFPPLSHNFPMFPSFSHHVPMCVAMTSLPVVRLRARPWHHRCPVSSLLGWPGGMGVLELMLIMLTIIHNP